MIRENFAVVDMIQLFWTMRAPHYNRRVTETCRESQVFLIIEAGISDSAIGKVVDFVLASTMSCMVVSWHLEELWGFRPSNWYHPVICKLWNWRLE